MEFTQIQNTGIRASRIGLGTWALGGWMWGGADDDAAITRGAVTLNAETMTCTVAGRGIMRNRTMILIVAVK